MKKCVYCGKEFDDEGIYFCGKCRKEIEESKTIQTGHAISNWVANALWFMEQNKGNYWKDLQDLTDEEKADFFIRPIDYVRFDKYRNCIGADQMEFAMSAENLNKMEKWYLDLAEKYGKE